MKLASYDVLSCKLTECFLQAGKHSSKDVEKDRPRERRERDREREEFRQKEERRRLKSLKER